MKVKSKTKAGMSGVPITRQSSLQYPGFGTFIPGFGTFIPPTN